MVGQSMLAWIDTRLRNLYDANLPFGGLSVILLGDFRQCKPVGARSLHNKTSTGHLKSSEIVEEGKKLYELFDNVLTLKKNYRLENTDKESTKEFLRHQLKVGDGDCADGDSLAYWKNFELSNNVDKRKDFEQDPETKYLVTSNPEADKINAEFVMNYASENDKTIHSWAAWNTIVTAMRAPHHKVWGLRSFIGVCEDAHVMLLVNLHQEAGLVNGSQGFVKDILFDENSNKFDVPLFVVIDFPNYTGPPWRADHPTWVPIPAFRARVNNRGRSERFQIPIVLARAVTIWKAQGMTLKKVIVQLCKDRHVYGLDYTDISRVTSEDGLLLYDFDDDVFTRVAESAEMERAKNEMKHLNDDIEPDTRKWTQYLRRSKIFKTYYNKKRHGKANRLNHNSMNVDVSVDTVDSMTDISNYNADAMNSIIGEYTMIQSLGWRYRMHTHNHNKTEHWQILASKPPPLGKRTTKRKRSPASTPKRLQRCDLQYVAFCHGTSLNNLKELKTNNDLTEHLKKKYKLSVEEISNETIPKTQNPFRHNKYQDALVDNVDPKFIDGGYSVLDIQYDLAQKIAKRNRDAEKPTRSSKKRRRKNKRYTNDDAIF